jgi:hypothetical protein
MMRCLPTLRLVAGNEAIQLHAKCFIMRESQYASVGPVTFECDKKLTANFVTNPQQQCAKSLP